ncbi:NAD(P)-dependent alcohol dehydrogenase [Halomicronema hongdechloris C2206]|uniref:NAD(P)-dependent alcohol dehydrogenase n=1 Tax=Halomicronema hongdechloris C2206 TaxID=1641165 RepID=A0A1Z3HSF1_9CYAN|nr:NAD(P)-dependent alcohol dehydrogenase [Halomicronema hongdechloris]ASC73241.1 NAD(P)-dependent alcohol dehydrogenase [Halomicronema hongdechloris C2206]
MKSIALTDAFGSDHLRLIATDLPDFGPDEILVKLQAAALNYVDLLLIKGDLNPDLSFPVMPVSDGAGVVEAVGSQVTEFQPGDRVVTTYIPDWIDGRYTPANSQMTTRPGMGRRPGQLAEYKSFRAHELIKRPTFLSAAEAATLPIAALTAWNALAYGQAKPGDTVLLHGTGGVSIFALQFAKAAGLRVIITSSSDHKLAKAAALGADHGINYRQTPDWVGEVLAATTGAGVDLVVETVGGQNLNRSLDALRLDGHISVVGFLEGQHSSLDLVSLNLKRAKLHGLSVGSRQDFADMLRAMAANQIHPVMDKTFPLEATPEAFRYLESGHHFGKVVIEI